MLTFLNFMNNLTSKNLYNVTSKYNTSLDLRKNNLFNVIKT